MLFCKELLETAFSKGYAYDLKDNLEFSSHLKEESSRQPKAIRHQFQNFKHEPFENFSTILAMEEKAFLFKTQPFFNMAN